MKINNLITPDINALMITPSLRMTIELNDFNIDDLFRNANLNNQSNMDQLVNEFKPDESNKHAETENLHNLTNTSNTLENEMEIDEIEKTRPSLDPTSLRLIDPNLLFSSQQIHSETNEGSSLSELETSSQSSYQELVTVTNIPEYDNQLSSQTNSPLSMNAHSKFVDEDSTNRSIEEKSIIFLSKSRSNGSVTKPYNNSRRRNSNYLILLKMLIL
jgi:hypothetical protein